MERWVNDYEWHEMSQTTSDIPMMTPRRQNYTVKGKYIRKRHYQSRGWPPKPLEGEFGIVATRGSPGLWRALPPRVCGQSGRKNVLTSDENLAQEMLLSLWGGLKRGQGHSRDDPMGEKAARSAICVLSVDGKMVDKRGRAGPLILNRMIKHRRWDTRHSRKPSTKKTICAVTQMENPPGWYKVQW